MNKKIISEYINPSTSNASVFMEDVADALGNKKKTLHMSGIFVQGDIKNQNGRVYPAREIERAVESVNALIASGHAPLGELDHPDDLTINLDRVSHSITKMWTEGPNGFGKLKLLPTPLGQLAGTLLEAGVKLGVSSRGSGNVDEYSGKVSDFEMITVDIVANPSAPNAYPKAVYEGLMNMKGGHAYLAALKGIPADEYHSNATLQQYITETALKAIKDMKL